MAMLTLDYIAKNTGDRKTIETFSCLFGHQFEVTPELLEDAAIHFDWDLMAEALLSAEGYSEYREYIDIAAVLERKKTEARAFAQAFINDTEG